MALINFNLLDIQNTEPFGDQKTGHTLHWFGLSDGYFWFELCDFKLLEYRQDIVANDSLKYSLPYVNYYLAQLYQDLDTILPFLFDTIPDDIYQHVDSLEKVKLFVSMCGNWLQESPDDEHSEKYWETYSNALFLNSRKLDLGYLQGAPSIWFLRHKDGITIQWVSNQVTDAGELVWTNSGGSCTISVSYFVVETQDFFNRLYKAMAHKVEQALKYNFVGKGIFIDLNNLIDENQRRYHEFEKIKETVHNMNAVGEKWNEVRKAISIVQNVKH